jgi:type IV pilus assembly protein PilO
MSHPKIREVDDLSNVNRSSIAPEQSSDTELLNLRRYRAQAKAFGIALTPNVLSTIFVVSGLAGGGYLFLNQLMPTWEKHQNLQTDLAQKQSQVQQKQEGLQQRAKIQIEHQQALGQQSKVLAMFGNEKNLNTMLLDLNQVIESANAKLPLDGGKAQLLRFVPGQYDQAIAENSPLNNKLKRRVFNIAFSATFEQTLAILRNIERLQPLLIAKDYQSTLAAALPVEKADSRVVRGPAIINTSFQLQALVPVASDRASQAIANGNHFQE